MDRLCVQIIAYIPFKGEWVEIVNKIVDLEYMPKIFFMKVFGYTFEITQENDRILITCFQEGFSFTYYYGCWCNGSEKVSFTREVAMEVLCFQKAPSELI